MVYSNWNLAFFSQICSATALVLAVVIMVLNHNHKKTITECIRRQDLEASKDRILQKWEIIFFLKLNEVWGRWKKYDLIWFFISASKLPLKEKIMCVFFFSDKWARADYQLQTLTQVSDQIKCSVLRLPTANSGLHLFSSGLGNLKP